MVMVRHRAVAARAVVEHNAPRPFRAPVHQLAIAHRGDRAIVGIAHAGEILAAVQLDRDAAVTSAAQLIAAARALGATDDEIASAAGLVAPQRPQSRTPRRPRAQRPARPSDVPCRDCGTTAAVAARGPVPRRCPACRAEQLRQYARDLYYRKRAKETT